MVGCAVLQFHENLAHPREVSWLAGLGTLDDDNGCLFVLILLPSLLFYSRHFVRNELCNCLPVGLISLGMKLLLIGQENLESKNTGQTQFITRKHVTTYVRSEKFRASLV